MNNETLKVMQKLASAMLDYAELDPSTKEEHLSLLGDMLDAQNCKLCPCGVVFERKHYKDLCGTCEEEAIQMEETRESAFKMWQSECHYNTEKGHNF